MLTELRIRNLAVIEEASLVFGPGLNVLSGETGAGKTIVMTALGLLTGSRASPELIRTGAKEAVIEAVFEGEGEAPLPIDSDYLDPENPRTLVLRRIIAEGGRGRVAVNDHPATVQALALMGPRLAQIYGQHEQQVLQQRENHLAMLDRHAGLERELSAYGELYERARRLQAEREQLDRREQERAQLLEIAQFRVAELERADLHPHEDETLAAERTLLANASKLAETATTVEQAIYAGDNAVIDALAKAAGRLSDGASLDPRLIPPLELITSARANLEEAAHTLSAYAAGLEADPARLEAIDARLNELLRLKRKYGGTVETALAMLESSRREIRQLETIGENRAAIDAELRGVLDQLAVNAQRLSTARAQVGAELARRMNSELKALGMRNASFDVRLDKVENADGLIHGGVVLGPTGSDSAEFYLAPNAGQPAMPLARVASGGELSRVMLALKRLEAQRRGVATLIFDEVDAGIGGAIAEVVGRKLKQLARFHQVLCVTHLAQIAAFADQHFVVEKDERRGVTRSRVAALEVDARPSEIARMLGGDETNDKFLRAARELIARAAVN